jgi:hypothetical protein
VLFLPPPLELALHLLGNVLKIAAAKAFTQSEWQRKRLLVRERGYNHHCCITGIIAVWPSR